MTLRVLIADDEATARRRLRRLLESLDDLVIVAECTNGREALDALDPSAVDVAVLDIHMPDLTGLDVAELTRASEIPIIFATADPSHAVDAFSHGVADYVLKPISAARLADAIGRVRRPPPSTRSVPARLPLEVRGEVRLIALTDITHAELDGTLVTVHARGEALVTELSLADLVRRLPDTFVRVHRRALLNLERVERLRPLDTGGYLAITDDGHEVPVSRAAARDLRRRFDV